MAVSQSVAFLSDQHFCLGYCPKILIFEVHLIGVEPLLGDETTHEDIVMLRSIFNPGSAESFFDHRAFSL